MGSFRSSAWVRTLAWSIAAVLITLNERLVAGQMLQWVAGGMQWVLWLAVPAAMFLSGLLVYLVVHAIQKSGAGVWEMGVSTASREVASKLHPMTIRHIGAALQHSSTDSSILSAAIGLAKPNGARIYLIHVVDTPSVLLLGKQQSSSLHATADQAYLEELAREVEEQDIPVEPVLLFGRPNDELVRIAADIPLDLLVLGSHGHRGVEDIFHGETVTSVRHRLNIPVMIVHSPEIEPALHRN
jgi:manganese transport protein